MKRIIFESLTFVVCLSFFSCTSNTIEKKQLSEEPKEMTSQRIINNLEVYDYGYYRVINKNGEMAPPEAFPDSGGSLKIIEQTDEIPIRENLLFGVRIGIENFPYQELDITWKVVFPEPGIYDSEKGEYYTEHVSIAKSYTTGQNFYWWHFMSKSEYIPGTWYFKFYYKDVLIYVKSFHVYEEEYKDKSLKPIRGTIDRT